MSRGNAHLGSLTDGWIEQTANDVRTQAQLDAIRREARERTAQNELARLQGAFRPIRAEAMKLAARRDELGLRYLLDAPEPNSTRYVAQQLGLHQARDGEVVVIDGEWGIQAKLDCDQVVFEVWSRNGLGAAEQRGDFRSAGSAWRAFLGALPVRGVTGRALG